MTSREYWKTRSLQLEQLLHNRTDKTVQNVAKIFNDAAVEMDKQIKGIFDYYHKKSGLTQNQALAELSQHETAEAREVLRELYSSATGEVKRNIWARLSAPAYSYRISRVQALRDNLYSQARLVGLNEEMLVQERLEDSYEQSYYRTVYDVQSQAGVYYDFGKLESGQVRAAIMADWNGKNWSERLWDTNEKFADAVQNAVTVGIMAGLPYEEIRDNFLNIIGVTDSNGAKANATRLIRTETNYVANQGHLLGYESAGIEKYFFLATLDERTTEICRSLDMKKFNVADAVAGLNLPPMHPNCRSTTMPDMSNAVLSKIKRAARDPNTGKTIQVPGTMTYQQWQKQYAA